MEISTRNIRSHNIRDDIINKIILNEIDVLANVNENVNSNHIAKMYGISCAIKNDMLNVKIIMEKFDFNLWQYALAY